MKLSIVGSGYVGLVTGAVMSHLGHEVVCVDLDPEKIHAINSGRPPIYEEGLAPIVETSVAAKRLRATSDLHEAVQQTEITMIAVGTPFDGERIDLKYVKDAARAIGRALKELSRYHVVVVKSTVVPGTTDRVVTPILEEESHRRAGRDFGVGMNPEFLREGVAVEDALHPDRIVIGGNDVQTRKVLSELYDVFSSAVRINVNNATAELIKYASNSFFATLISFSNEIAALSSRIPGVDIADVMNGVYLDRRMSVVDAHGERRTPDLISYLWPGCGFGGSCFPKDVKAIASELKRLGGEPILLQAVIDRNNAQIAEVMSLLVKHFKKLSGKKIAVLGVAFKPGTDDIRESPSVNLIDHLLNEQAEVLAVDPIVTEIPHLRSPELRWFKSLESVTGVCDAVVLMTSWKEFKKLENQKVEAVVIDGRRFLDKSKFSRYEGIGLNAGAE
ncbi:MAG: nucleotide sugar dehydrogenase [bacterium]|nr:nucleotide sugar dehydrogenase [bacterium]